MREFELMYVVDGTMPEEEAAKVAEAVQSFISSHGTIVKVDPWGRRRLAYPIKKKQDGYYWVITFEVEPDAVDVLKQQLRVNESILRWMVTRVEHRRSRKTVAEPEVQQAPAAEVASTPAVQPESPAAVPQPEA
ncbi:MAG TPA: 30S ribosomal protein S6 [Candidatus Cryosericum sp.]|nr:30S ribosomal protein S6 [Candidatus Cryosericum sp.]